MSDPASPSPDKPRSSAGKQRGVWVLVKTRRVWLRRLAAVFLILAVAAGLFYWKRAALRRHANDWSAERHLHHAERELADGNHRVALSRALTAIGLDTRRIEPLRVLCTSAREIGDSRLLLYATALAEHAEATDADRLTALAAFSEIGDARRFSAFFESLPAEVRALPEARLERLRHRLALGDGAGVAAALEIDPELLATWPGPLLRLEALWQRTAPGDDEAAAGLAESLLIGELPPDDRTLILGGLSRLPPSRLPQTSANRLLAALGETPGPDEPPTLRDTLRLAAEPERREALVAEAVERLRTSALDPLSRWLVALGEIDAVLELTDDPRTLTVPGPYEARARALIERERYLEALTLLRYAPADADAVDMAVLEAASARALERRSDEIAAWTKARLAAERDQTRNRHLGLAAAATRAGEEAVAADALVAACRHPLGLVPSAREIAWVINYLTEHDRPEDLLAVTGRLLQWEGDEPVLLNNAVYLSLIFGQQLGEGGVEIMADLVERHPELPGLRNTLALARLVEGDAAGALALFAWAENAGGTGDGVEIAAVEDLSPAARAVYALALAGTGDIAGFDAVADGIPMDELLEQERLFFEERSRPHREPPGEESEVDEDPAAASGGKGC